MWRRLRGSIPPSHHAIRATCVKLLPLLEMFCRWELQEDRNNIWQLMLRFDSEAALETHVLGRSLFLMVRDDDVGLEILPPHQNTVSPVNPFDAIRARLAEVDVALQTLHAQVQLNVDYFLCIAAAGVHHLPPAEAVCMFTVFYLQHSLEFNFFTQTVSPPSPGNAVSAPSPCWCLHSIALVLTCDFIGLSMGYHSAAWHNSFRIQPFLCHSQAQFSCLSRVVRVFLFSAWEVPVSWSCWHARSTCLCVRFCIGLPPWPRPSPQVHCILFSAWTVLWKPA